MGHTNHTIHTCTVCHVFLILLFQKTKGKLTGLINNRVIVDTYQYFLHRTFHEIPFLYKHFHSMHHRLYVPFAFGSLYGHPFEGAILDGAGAGLAHTLSGLSTRQAIFFFAFTTYKTVDDHCGYNFPWHPVHMLFGNNADYHDIHHQVCCVSLVRC